MVTVINVFNLSFAYSFHSRACYVAIAGAIVAYLVVDTAGSRHRLISVAGLFFYIFVCFLFSTNPAKVCLLSLINWFCVAIL